MSMPPFTIEDARQIAEKYYGLKADAAALSGELDRNFLLTTEEERYVLKFGNASLDPAVLDMQIRALKHLGSLNGVPQLVSATSGDEMITLYRDGIPSLVRMYTYLPGKLLAEQDKPTPAQLRELGTFLAHLDLELRKFHHPAMHRDIPWNLGRAHLVIRPRLAKIADPVQREQVEHVLARWEGRVLPLFHTLRSQVIHNDANDYNVLLDDGAISGLLDFGDMLYAPLVCEPAIAAAYALLGREDPLEAAGEVVRGYHTVLPLHDLEICLLYDLICIRLAVSLAVSSERAITEPDNYYHQISAAPAWDALGKLLQLNPQESARYFREKCPLAICVETGAGPGVAVMRGDEILAYRHEHVGPSLSLSYDYPLYIVRGQGQYLYDADDVPYLDCVNNVCHVGHSHPRVVAALANQAMVLNTNTRYLHENIVRLAQRLTEKLPEKLSVCFFVNSGSEANDLALRLARAFTGQRDMLVLDGAYHGNLSSLIEISPYKFRGPGGSGAPPWVHTLEMPCAYRGAFRKEPDPVAAYAAQAERFIDRIRAEGRGIAAFIAEAIMGTGGQVVFPGGYLSRMVGIVHTAGGVYIADEVQVGFGRVGSRFWGFELHEVVPDIVTVGKPFGNGHPLAAVVTTPEIAAAFDNGMEYFNTFGGNPVSCAVGLSVLDVIEDEQLQAHAMDVGAQLLSDLALLKERHALVGDVRGSGLFLGVEMVCDRDTLEPASEEAHLLVEAMRKRQILLSVDGPSHNVIKIKPPLVFNEQDADHLVRAMNESLALIEK